MADIEEKSHRGLVRPLGKRIRETVRGFESHLLRHLNEGLTQSASFFIPATFALDDT